jgi:hypothetical protein
MYGHMTGLTFAKSGIWWGISDIALIASSKLTNLYGKHTMKVDHITLLVYWKVVQMDHTCMTFMSYIYMDQIFELYSPETQL